MKKKMTAPKKTPPASAAASAGSADKPTIQVDDLAAASSTDHGDAAPTLTPPAQEGQDDAFGAAVWNQDKRVNGLYATSGGRNSWMSIAGTGWVRLANANDSACEAMTILAGAARAKNTRIDYAIDGGLTTEVYVW